MILLEFHNIVCFMVVNFVPFVDEKKKRTQKGTCRMKNEDGRIMSK